MSKPCEFAYTCEFSQPECREPCETPLLVDELAAVAKDLMLFVSSDMINIAHYIQGTWTVKEVNDVVEAREAVRQVLIRYQKEVGDGDV